MVEIRVEVVSRFKRTNVRSSVMGNVIVVTNVAFSRGPGFLEVWCDIGPQYERIDLVPPLIHEFQALGYERYSLLSLRINLKMVRGFKCPIHLIVGENGEYEVCPEDLNAWIARSLCDPGP